MARIKKANKKDSRKQAPEVAKDTPAKAPKRLKQSNTIQSTQAKVRKGYQTTAIKSRPEQKPFKLTKRPNASRKVVEQAFRHEPLDTAKQEIRLCQILPRDPRDPDNTIHCTITHHILDAPADSPFLRTDLAYIALSYCWGDPANPRTISTKPLPFIRGWELVVRML
jgi:hypothetical protein